ncbi:hypothetical protein KFE25_000322 [Diacronema lutheri]|uniref:Phosphoribosyltransferase domain-containing protein n=2 Tax=Diacronema lutheri TaxID=2081491 RepID=A0A8J5XE09_DIALT|nr:hypothetical protein KFE25_000322 [Diacronema lutheri]
MSKAEDAQPLGGPAPKRQRSPPQGFNPTKYVVLSYKTLDTFARRLEAADPERFSVYETKWGKFDDSGMDNIVMGGFSPVNVVMRSHVLFLADFNSNDAILSQLHVLVMLCESFIATLTIYLPYLPTATMERITVEGEVATANTVCRILSGLPHTGGPSRIMFYDLHTLQNRFYLHTGAIATMHTTIPLIKEVLARKGSPIEAIAFPDEGAQKRFGSLFAEYDVVTCGKKRVGNERNVVIQDGDCQGKHVLIIDDMVKTGGTLVECAKALMLHGASAVSAYCAHAAFPHGAEYRFCKGGDRAVFSTFFVTNSNTTVVERILALPKEETLFEVLDILPLVINDL